MNNVEYSSMGLTTTIKVENSTTIKVRDNYYKFTYAKTFTHLSDKDLANVDFDIKRKILVDEVNKVIDDQIDEVVELYKN